MQSESSHFVAFCFHVWLHSAARLNVAVDQLVPRLAWGEVGWVTFCSFLTWCQALSSGAPSEPQLCWQTASGLGVGMVLSPAQQFSQLRDNVCIVFSPAEPCLRLNTQLSSKCLSRLGAFTMFTSVYACRSLRREKLTGAVICKLNQSGY